MQRKNKSDDGPLPTHSSKRIPSQHVSALPLHKGKENTGLPRAACSRASQHNQIGKSEFLAAEAQHAWAEVYLPLPCWKNLSHVPCHTFEWLCFFRLLSSFRHVHQGGFVRRVCSPQPELPEVARSRGVEGLMLGDIFKKTLVKGSDSGFL